MIRKNIANNNKNVISITQMLIYMLLVALAAIITCAIRDLLSG
jgi:hypothetical protein